MIKSIKKFLLQDKKDIYQVKVIAIKDGVDLFSFRTKIYIKKNAIPSRRIVAKLYSDVLNQNIKNNIRNHGCKVQVVITCKVGTFYTEDIRETMKRNRSL